MSKRNKYILGAGILLVVTVVSILYLNRNITQGLDEECFKVGYLDITASAPLFISQDRSLFEKQDICIETQLFATSNQLVDAIASDRIDYVVETSAVPALALQIQSPGRFFITAASTISESEPFDAILVPTGSDIAGLLDLAGRKISVFPGTTAQNLLRAFLIDQGVDVSEIEFLPTPPPNLLASVKSGAVDATEVARRNWTGP